MVGAGHCPFPVTPKAFNGVGSNVAVTVLLLAVVDRLAVVHVFCPYMDQRKALTELRSGPGF